ncbi:MAG: hypothetical protein FWH25_01225, partial [Syntrophorhabdaceae bacterium]|nr:hypothetical protein [Syntrophorhabdaceae bacterium]
MRDDCIGAAKRNPGGGISRFGTVMRQKKHSTLFRGKSGNPPFGRTFFRIAGDPYRRFLKPRF